MLVETPEEKATEETTVETNKSNQPNKFPHECAVWVGDIPNKTTEKEIIDLFSSNEKFNILSVKMGQGKGKHYLSQFAFVNFNNKEGIRHALSLDGTEFKGNTIVVSERQNEYDVHKIFLGRLLEVETQEDLTKELSELGDWKPTKIEFNAKSKFGFAHFKTEPEAIKFYDDMKGKSIKGHEVSVEFPRSKRERRAIQQGASKVAIDKMKRTVYMSDLKSDTTTYQVRAFCTQNECGTIMDINKPVPKKKQAIMFVQFERKTDADRFVMKWGNKENGEINGSTFLASISKAKIPIRDQRKFGGKQFQNPYAGIAGYGGAYRPGAGGAYGSGGMPRVAYGYGGFGGYPGFVNPFLTGAPYGPGFQNFRGRGRRGRGRGRNFNPY